MDGQAVLGIVAAKTMDYLEETYGGDDTAVITDLAIVVAVRTGDHPDTSTQVHVECEDGTQAYVEIGLLQMGISAIENGAFEPDDD